MTKARAAKLKVFRTPIGFHDAYVAAASQKAALEAWGADSNLFAQGIAEVVTDPALAKEVLASPGTVIKRARGSTGEHLQAIGEASRPRQKDAKSSAKKDKPDRAALDEAEAALAVIDKARRAEVRALEDERRSLERRAREAERRHEAAMTDAEATRDRRKRAYDRAMRKWQR